MAEASLTKKMKRKVGGRAAIINPPSGYEAVSFPELEKATSSLDGKFDWIQIFAKNQAELKAYLPKAVRALKSESLLWVSFPKGSSKIQTDLNRDNGWEVISKTSLKLINLISVNETWSAFSLRPYREGEAKQDLR